jgi:type IV conjugative transfer system protein TraL
MRPEYEKYLIPSHLDAPNRFVYCTMLEWAIFSICVMFGLFLKSFGIGFLAGLSFILISKKIQERVGSSDILSMIYWHFPVWLSSFKHFPISHKRDYSI